MTGPKALILTLAMAGGLLALAVGLRGPYQRMAADYWRTKLSRATDEEIPILVHDVSDLEGIGLPVLIDSLDSPREILAQAAHNTLADQLARWQSLDDVVGAKGQASLAQELAARSTSFSPSGIAASGDLVTRILQWRPKTDLGNRETVIAACETVLQRRRQADRDRQRTRVTTQMASAPEPTARQPVAAVEEPSPGEPPSRDPADAVDAATPLAESPSLMSLENAVVHLARLPGGGLPIDSFPSAKALGVSSGIATQDVLPAQLPDQSPARALASGVRPGSDAFANSAVSPIYAREVATRDESDAQPIRAMSLTEDVRPENTNETLDGKQVAGDLGKIDVVEVMRLMQSPQPRTVAGAREELTRRGFGEVQIELARRLFTADSEVRRELARTLPALKSVDPVPWLLWLGRDPDAEVRLTAITLMATVRDQRLLGEIERLAREDSDPRIQRCAEQLSQQRAQEMNGARPANIRSRW